jgi:hypothetical protein
MGKMVRSVLVGAVILMLASFTFAWDDVGHRTMAYIAWQQMTPAARESVIKILRSAPEDSDISAYYIGGPEPDETKKLEYFMLMATWADIVRERSLEARNKKYHHSNWHYDDTFWKQVNGKAEILPSPEEGGVAIDKLIDFDKVLRNASATDKEKAIAIVWIEHLIGDIHQPLHTSGRVTDREPKGDQGGNLFLLTPEGTPREKQMNLHWYWDSIVGQYMPLKGDECDREYISKVGRKIMKKYPANSLSAAMRLGEYDEWRKESFALNPTDVFSPDLVRFQMPSEKYKKHAFQVAERQLALAGYRLAATFNQIFTTAPVAAKPTQ